MHGTHPRLAATRSRKTDMMSPTQDGLRGEGAHEQNTEELVRDADGAGVEEADDGADGDADGGEGVERPVVVEGGAGGGGAWGAKEVDCHGVADEEGQGHEEAVHVPWEGESV